MAEETLAGQDLLAAAVKDLNEKDAKGAVGKIKSLLLLVQRNDTEIAKLQENNKELLKQAAEHAGSGTLSVDRFKTVTE